jgi:hypothetical protein
MLIESIEARKHGVHRDSGDVVIAGVIGLVLLLLVPAKEKVPYFQEPAVKQ